MTAAVREAADAGWVVCDGCRMITYRRRLARALGVCSGCGRHARLSATERLRQLLDPGSETPLEPAAVVEDPLSFVDRLPYRDRLRQARTDTGLDEAVRCVRGTILGHPLAAAVMDFNFLGGSLGSAVGERIACAARVALRERVPLLLVTASGGARMQEGALALMQMVKTSQSMAELDEAGILTITVVTDPTYGGTAASFATLADVIVAEPGARIGFAGPRVIEQTIKSRLPEGFQTAEFTLGRGLIDGVVPRAALRATLGRLLGLVRPGQCPADPPAARRTLIREVDRIPTREPWASVRNARATGRPTTLDYLGGVLDEFHELHGDRLGGDCPAVVGGLGRFRDQPVVVVGHEKGRDTASRVARNFGMPSPAGNRKAHRLMRLAAKLRVPLLTFVDTPGAYPGVEAEEGGQAWAIAENIRYLATLPVPVVTVITGEGGSGGALALAVADRVLALEHAVYSVISPEGCAAILWNRQDAAPLAAAALGLDARELLGRGIVDAIVAEPEGGAQADPAGAVAAVRDALSEALDELRGYDPNKLVSLRRCRFQRFGLAREVRS